MSAGAVILAAGRGSRLGGVAKALLPIDRTTFLGRIAARCREVGVAPCLVVVGPPFAAEVAAAAEPLGLEVMENPAPERGMASSIAVGFDAASRRFAAADAALLWPVDHPRVGRATLEALVERRAAGRVVIPTFGGRGGHPACVGRELWRELAGCAAMAGGARAVFRARPERVVRLPVSDAGVFRDVDVPADLEGASG